MKSGLKILAGFAVGAAAGYLLSKNMDTVVDCFDRVCYKLDDLQDQLADYRARMAMKEDDEEELCDLNCEECEEEENCPLKDDVAEVAEDVQEKAAEVAEEVKDAAEDLADEVKEKAEDLFDGAKEIAEDVADKFEEVKENLSDIAGDFNDEIKF